MDIEASKIEKVQMYTNLMENLNKMRRSPRMKFACKYPNCKSRYYNPTPEGFVNKHFFTFPKDVDLNLLWKKACNIKHDSKGNRICGDHFQDTHFLNIQKDRLAINAVPTTCDEVTVLNDILVQSQTDVEASDVLSSENNSISNCLQEHDYSLCNNKETPYILNNYDYLKDTESVLDETITEDIMYSIHNDACSKLSKLRLQITNLKKATKTLKKLYKANYFQIIDQNLNLLDKQFINSQLFNNNENVTSCRWTECDIAFALSIYKRSSHLYKYLRAYFLLPSTSTLKSILSKIPFEPGLNKPILHQLRSQILKMDLVDRYCVLLLDETPLYNDEPHTEESSSFENLGTLGNFTKSADHALVFMIRGIHKQWKQVVAYYFTLNTIAILWLKFLIKELISTLQDIGLNVIGAVCNKGRHKSAIVQLCTETSHQQSTHYFYVNKKPIVLIYNVPDLLKNTRDALVWCKIEYEHDKYALFEYIHSVFNFDQKRTFKSLPKLKKEHFHLSDSFVKKNTMVAAAQLSYSVAVAIESYGVYGKMLPPDCFSTAEFVAKIDNLFDSLNGSILNEFEIETKPLRSVLKSDSPHMNFWTKILQEIKQWTLIDLKTDKKDVTHHYIYIHEWQITIKSIMFLWNNLKNIGFDYINLRALNLDPLENLFFYMEQHRISNVNPTCSQFTATLKAIMVNELSLPIEFNSHCEDDMGVVLENFQDLLRDSFLDEGITEPDSQ